MHQLTASGRLDSVWPREPAPLPGPAPLPPALRTHPGAACPAAANFSGHDVQLVRSAASKMGLQEGRDFVFRVRIRRGGGAGVCVCVCMGPPVLVAFVCVFGGRGEGSALLG